MRYSNGDDTFHPYHPGEACDVRSRPNRLFAEQTQRAGLHTIARLNLGYYTRSGSLFVGKHCVRSSGLSICATALLVQLTQKLPNRFGRSMWRPRSGLLQETMSLSAAAFLCRTSCHASRRSNTFGPDALLFFVCSVLFVLLCVDGLIQLGHVCERRDPELDRCDGGLMLPVLFPRVQFASRCLRETMAFSGVRIRREVVFCPAVSDGGALLCWSNCFFNLLSPPVFNAQAMAAMYSRCSSQTLQLLTRL